MNKATPSDPKPCEGRRKDGQPCRAFALASGYCFSHDPARQAEREAAHRRGGFNSSKVARLKRLIPERLLPVYALLEQALGEVHEGRLDPKRANAMASLARAMVSVLTAGEMEERLRRLEGDSKEV